MTNPVEHEPVCEYFHKEFTGLEQWLTSILIYTEELGRERGYFDAKSPYMKTYQRKLTLEEQAMREAYRPMAIEDHQEEVDEAEEWDEEHDFNL